MRRGFLDLGVSMSGGRNSEFDGVFSVVFYDGGRKAIVK